MSTSPQSPDDHSPASTDDHRFRRGTRRPAIDGILLLDKPVGPTSFHMVHQVRKTLGIRKVGHTGTLDPFASGLLVLCLGDATRASQYIASGEKEYEGLVRLGQATDTMDSTGVVIAEKEAPQWGEHTHCKVRKQPSPADNRCPSPLGHEALEKAAASLVGTITQVPPAHSAIKVGGRALYHSARAGEEVEVPPRQVVIHSLEARWHTGREIAIKVRCGPGTYVRSLAKDLGAALGYPAHLSVLRRTVNGVYRVEDAFDGALLLEEERHSQHESQGDEAMDLLSNLRSPVQGLASHIGLMTLTEDTPWVRWVKDGKALALERVRVDREPSDSGENVAVLTASGILLAMGRLDGDKIVPVRVFNMV